VATLVLTIERPGRPAETATFDAEELFVGRRDGVDIPIPDTNVSRRHARIFRRGDAWFVEDLASRNGTKLNGVPVSGPAPFAAGDTVRIGDVTLRMPAPEGSAPRPGPVASASDEHLTTFSVIKPAASLIEASGDAGQASSRLRMLNEVHRALAAPVSRDALLQIVLDHAFAALQPEYAAVFLLGPGGDLARAAERRSSTASAALLISRRLAEEVTVKGAAALVLDAQLDERFASESVILSGVRSIVAAPLSDAEGCLGMIALYSHVQAKRFTEADLELLVSLAAAAALRVRNIALVEQAVERRALDRELALAREIQAGMLRHRILERPEVSFAARQVPAHLVGGDFYEFQADLSRLWFVIGDVAGKGMAAALMMAMAQTLFRATAGLGRPIEEVMAHLNRDLARDNDRAMFVTALGGCLNLETGLLHLVNAGHNLPYRVRRDGSFDLVRAANGVALGVVDDAVYPVTTMAIEPGEALLAYTDGVCDALSPSGAAFGTSGLERHLGAVGRLAADAVVASVFEMVERFAEGAPQEDDVTVVVIRYHGPPRDRLSEP
jgi:sigma-B regulation protein RsbU (phosphoserine phosphatase)